MRHVLFVLILVAGGVAVADDDPPAQPRPEEEPPAPPAPPAQGLPPIHINITNNNNGNNSNTSTQSNQQDNEQDNKQDNQQTNTQTNTQTQQLPPAAPAPEIAPVASVEPRGCLSRHAGRLGRQRWIAIGALGGQDGKGVRASMDLVARRAWSLGLAASASGDGHDHHFRRGEGEGGVVAYVAWTRRLGPLAVRAQLGFGVGKRGGEDRVHGDDVIARTTTDPGAGDDDDDGRPNVARRAEAALLFRIPLGKRLGLVGGPVITGTRDRDDRDDDRRDGERGRGGQVEKAMFLGLSFRY